MALPVGPASADSATSPVVLAEEEVQILEEQLELLACAEETTAVDAAWAQGGRGMDDQDRANSNLGVSSSSRQGSQLGKAAYLALALRSLLVAGGEHASTH